MGSFGRMWLVDCVWWKIEWVNVVSGIGLFD